MNYAELYDRWMRADHLLSELKEVRDGLLKDLQSVCVHLNIVQHGYPRRLRACQDCGLWENAPVADPGNEYGNATFGEFKVLVGSAREVTREELFKARR